MGPSCCVALANDYQDFTVPTLTEQKVFICVRPEQTASKFNGQGNRKVVK